MIIINNMNGKTLPRRVASTLDELLRIMPIVVLTGARQSGKSTLAQKLTTEPRRFVSLDDLDALEIARRDPEALIGGPQHVTIDEVQREPELLSAVKLDVDRNRRPGKFLLTGSANLLLMRRVSESLAGRASYITLWPMTRREQLGMGTAGIWETLVDARDVDWHDVVAGEPNEPTDWRELALRGGFPMPAIEFKSPTERSIWFDGYVRTYLERDLLQLSAISALPDFRRLMRAASLRLGSVINQTGIGRDVAISQPTVGRYLNLLETSYLLVRLHAFAINRTKRLIKSPKLYWGDTGIALHLARTTEPEGVHLENLVLNDLLCWRDARLEPADVFYWRTSTGEEVDFVIEVRNKLVPIEVKSTKRPKLSDVRHLRTFRMEYGEMSRCGLLIHAGSRTEWITSDVLAVPWWRII